MKKTLVIGASGGMGYALVKELSARGVDVIAFARNQEKMERLYKNDTKVSILKGDIFNMEDLQAASKGVDIIIHAANIPYPEWNDKLPILINNLLQAANTNSSKLAIVDNIYAYGRSPGKLVDENSPKKPHTKKGRIRLEMEELVKASGIPYIIAHFPDFYGPNAENTILNYALQNVVDNKKSMFVGNQKIAREYIYTPDGAKALVTLALNDQAYFQNWNIPGYDVITGEDIIQQLREITGFAKKVTTVTKGMIQLLGILNPMMREVVEMYYLNEEPVILSGAKYEKEFGVIPKTSYREGLEATIKHMSVN